MNMVSFWFLGFVAGSLVLFHLCRSLRTKRVVLFLTNAVFFFSFVSHPAQALPIAIVLLLGFTCLRFVGPARPTWRLGLGIAVLVVVFVYLKKYAFLENAVPFIERPYTVVGLSYVLFRMIHLLVDTQGGALRERLSLARFLNYSCFFLNWVSGPIQRFEEYDEQERAVVGRSPSAKAVYDAFSRIVNGYFKVALVSALLLHWHEGLKAALVEWDTPWSWMIVLAAACASYTLYLYYNFAGYMDIVIGIGRLYGFELPENFTKPFAAKNFLDFWSRWHITLSEWFKFYVFNPVTKFLAYRWSDPKAMPYLGVATFFITFLLMGIWHGSTSQFVTFGLFLGGGVSANRLYQVMMRQRFGKKRYARFCANPFYAALCRGTVFGFFAVALACFWLSQTDMTDYLIARGLSSFIAAFAVLSMAAALVSSAVGGLAALARTAGRPLAPAVQHGAVQQIWLAAKAYLVLVLILVNHTAVPEFVYLAF